MTPADAVAAVTAALTPTWVGGTFAIDAVYQDGQGHLVTYGNAEYLTGDDPRFLLLNAPVALVSPDGVVSLVPYLGIADRIEAAQVTDPTGR